MCQRQTKLEALEKELAELNKQVCECKQWPQIDDIYHHMESGIVSHSYWENDAIDNHRRNFLGVFKTKEEVEKKLALVKGLVPSKRWRPERSEPYWYLEVNSFEPKLTSWVENTFHVSGLMRGNVHKTKGDAEEYARILKEAYDAGV